MYPAKLALSPSLLQQLVSYGGSGFWLAFVALSLDPVRNFFIANSNRFIPDGFIGWEIAEHE